MKRAFITTTVALYLQACHLQYEETEATLLAYLMAGTDAGQPGNSGGDQSGAGKAGLGNSGNSGKNDDDETEEETNLGSSLVNNTGHILSDAEVDQATNTELPKEGESARQATKEVASTSPGGAGDSRIIGGVNPEDDEIDWNDAIDEGTKDADAATG